MTIRVTDEMIADARDASAALTGHCSTYAETRASIEAVLAIIDRDYVTRWGEVKIPIPREMPITPDVLKYLKNSAIDQAKYMGATVVNIDSPTVTPSEDFFTDMNLYTWRIRRD